MVFTGGVVKVATAIVIALIAVGALVGAYFWGLYVGMRRNYDARLRELGLNKTSATLYVRATKILRRLDRLGEFDGDQAPDRLSPGTKADIAKWATDYRIGGSL